VTCLEAECETRGAQPSCCEDVRKEDGREGGRVYREGNKSKSCGPAKGEKRLTSVGGGGLGRGPGRGCPAHIHVQKGISGQRKVEPHRRIERDYIQKSGWKPPSGGRRMLDGTIWDQEKQSFAYRHSGQKRVGENRWGGGHAYDPKEREKLEKNELRVRTSCREQGGPKGGLKAGTKGEKQS